MFKRKFFWYTLQAGSVAVWVFNIVGLAKPYTGEALRKIWKITLPVWAILHPLEIPLAYRLAGKGAGLSLKRTVVKTLLCGLTWWLPVRLGVLTK